MQLSDALEIVRLTDVGLHREHNEDTLASDSSIGLVLLADGMGGYNAGEVASEIAALSISAELKEALVNHSINNDAGDLSEIQAGSQLIINAVKNANEAIFNASQTQPQCAGMGTTLVVGLFINNQLLVGHIGDSRMYRLRDQRLTPITEDHSLLQEQINAGLITREQAKYSVNKNLVTRALGIDPEVELTLNAYAVEVGDIYLVCSDGLTDLVDDDVIQFTLNNLSLDLTKAAQILVEAANDSGGKDNISVILIKVNKPFEYKHTWYDNFFSWLK
jgi:protein phosphatase